MAAKKLGESAVVRSLRTFRDRYFSYSRKADEEDAAPNAEEPGGYLDGLPVDLQFHIMTFLSPADICRLGSASRYWRALVKDPMLWKYFLLRDMPYWHSIDHLTMPQLDQANASLIIKDKSRVDGEEGEDEGMKLTLDYMSEYLKACPSCRQQWLPSRPAYQVVSSFLQSLVPSAEPRYAMFGPGMEQLDVSLVTRLMHAPDVLPIAGTPHRQINGIGSGISYMFNNQHRFNILTLYSTNRAERERARVDPQSVSNKLFIFEGEDESGHPVYSPAPQVLQACQAVEGFIYVANAEPGKSGGRFELAQIQAVLNSVSGPTSRPLLVLSCVSRESPATLRTSNHQNGESTDRHRTPCIDMAERLGLPQLRNPWMVQDTTAETLSGLLDGIAWLLRCSGLKL